MNEPKFRGAYCKYLKKYLSIYEIIELEAKDNEYFDNNIRYSLLCPECKKAPLSFVHGNTKYLKVFPKHQHEENCSLIQDNVDNSKMIEIINDEKNNIKINEKLKKFARSTFIDKNSVSQKEILQLKNTDKENANNIITSSSKVKRVKCIPRQNISKGVFVEDVGIYKFFYGKIFLVWYKKYSNSKLLAFSSLTEKHSMFSITMSDKVASYVKKTIPESKSLKEVNIVFLSALEKKKNGYYNFHIKHSTHFVVVSQNT